MEKVRTTMRPDEEIEVSDTEAKDLRKLGLIPEVVEQSAENRTPAASGNQPKARGE